jgi:spore germination protein YaaH
MRFRLLSLLALVLVLVASVLAPAQPVQARSYMRWAYYVPDDPRSYRSLQAARPYIDVVAPDAWRIRPDGSITSRVQPRVIAQMRAWGLRVVPMVQKWSWYDKMHPFFASPAARQRAASDLADLVVGGKYDGINIDIENIEPRDGPALEAFVADLAARLHANGRLVSMALPARTSGGYYDGFNYARLAAHLDYANIMAYDYGWSGGQPMPVAPISWVRAVTAYTASQIPRGKVLLGIPWYGYDWNTSTRRPATYVSFGQAVGKGGTRGYDAAAQSPSVRYSFAGQQHVIWYEDARSIGAKLDVVVNQGLAGWAAWRLGYEDPAVWSSLSARR